MWFRNLHLWRFPDGVIESADQLGEALEQNALRECGPLEQSTIGFGHVLKTGMFTFELERCVLFSVATHERILPAAVITDELQRRLALIAEREDRRVGGRERKRLKDEIYTDFLPRAFTRHHHTLAYVDLSNGWLVIDTSSRRTAEEVVTQLREALGSFPCTPMAPEESPRALMTEWLVSSKLPDAYTLGDECELRDPAETGAIVRCRRQDLETDECREHLKTGKQVFHLGLAFDDRISFTLGEDLVVRKLRFLDQVLDEMGEADGDSAMAELNSRFALMTLELKRLFESLAEQFGITREGCLRMDGGTASPEMRSPLAAAIAKAAALTGATDAELEAAYARDPGNRAAIKAAKKFRDTVIKGDASVSIELNGKVLAEIKAPQKTTGGKFSKALVQSAQLMECRQRVQKLFATSEEYDERMAQYGARLVEAAKEHEGNVMKAAIDMGRDSPTPDFWLAAAVELIEPRGKHT